MIAARLAILLAACVLVSSSALSDSSDTNFEVTDHIPSSHPMMNEDIGYMNNVMDDYRRHINPRLSADVNIPPSQDMYHHYQMWKRNANIINTLLGFNRRLLLAGR